MFKHFKALLRTASDPGGEPHAGAQFPAALRPALGGVQTLLLLGARWMPAQAFFLSGLTKLRDWDITLALFQDEYAVPLLSPDVAAVMGTGGELLLPAMLMLGLGGRFAAAGLFVLNGVAVLSLAEIAPAAMAQHQLWGVLLLGVWFWGPGRLSVDALLARWFNRSA
jgi:putative oxidoreductase